MLQWRRDVNWTIANKFRLRFDKNSKHYPIIHLKESVASAILWVVIILDIVVYILRRVAEVIVIVQGVLQIGRQ